MLESECAVHHLSSTMCYMSLGKTLTLSSKSLLQAEVILAPMTRFITMIKWVCTCKVPRTLPETQSSQEELAVTIRILKQNAIETPSLHSLPLVFWCESSCWSPSTHLFLPWTHPFLLVWVSSYLQSWLLKLSPLTPFLKGGRRQPRLHHTEPQSLLLHAGDSIRKEKTFDL